MILIIREHFERVYFFQFEIDPCATEQRGSNRGARSVYAGIRIFVHLLPKLRVSVSVEAGVVRVERIPGSGLLSESYPPSSKIHIQFPARESMLAVELIWYDGGIEPKRPEEALRHLVSRFHSAECVD